MAGYRCVNFHDLCRLCCSSATGTSNGVQISSIEGLQKKIVDCLSISLSENDKLPKVICSTCKEYIDVFSEFRKTSKNAQKMLEGCLNTSKLRRDGQVYIKDEMPIKKVLKPIQNPSPTKIVPNLNLCNIIAATPTKQQQQQQPVKKTVVASPAQPAQDFLSSIMQAVGIQAGEEVADSLGNVTVHHQQNIQQQQQQQATISALPQYTLTLDGNTLKTGQIQYKIENPSNILSQTSLLTAKSLQDIQKQQMTINDVDEFLKLKQKPGLIFKRETKNQNQSDEPKDKKPKYNLILQAAPKAATPAKIQQPQLVSPQPKAAAAATATTFTSPNKAQILNIEKIFPASHQTSPTKQLVVPIMVRSDGCGNTVMAGDAASQMFSKALAAASHGLENKSHQQQQQQPLLVQMKLQPNADGQLTLTPVQAAPQQQHQQQQQPLQLALSPQQLQQLNFQTFTQQPQQQSISVQPAQMTVQQVAPAPTAQDIQTQTVPIPAGSLDKSASGIADGGDEDDDLNNDAYNDDYYLADEDEPVLNDSQEKQPIKKISSVKKSTKTVKSSKAKAKGSDGSLTELQSVNAEHSEMAKKQLNQLTSFSNKRAETEASGKGSDLNLTVCDVCKKIFKRKEFLMQHLKSHIGLRPFKCTDSECNKAFSRKEHLLRHISSHTGTKEFTCNVCNKLFSRKDNLNKHKRIHPETGQQNARHKQLMKQEGTSDGKENDEDADEKEKEVKVKNELVIDEKEVKIKSEKKPDVVKTVSIQQNPVNSQPQQQQQQPKIVQVLQQAPQMAIKTDGQTQQLITLSMSHPQSIFTSQQQSKAIYTFPPNSFILNPNGTIMAATNNELKFDTQ